MSATNPAAVVATQTKEILPDTVPTMTRPTLDKALELHRYFEVLERGGDEGQEIADRIPAILGAEDGLISLVDNRLKTEQIGSTRGALDQPQFESLSKLQCELSKSRRSFGSFNSISTNRSADETMRTNAARDKIFDLRHAVNMFVAAFDTNGAELNREPEATPVPTPNFG